MTLDELPVGQYFRHTCGYDVYQKQVRGGIINGVRCYNMTTKTPAILSSGTLIQPVASETIDHLHLSDLNVGDDFDFISYPLMRWNTCKVFGAGFYMMKPVVSVEVNDGRIFMFSSNQKIIKK